MRCRLSTIRESDGSRTPPQSPRPSELQHPRRRLISATDASLLVDAAGDEIGAPYSTLDHTIWRFEARGETGP